MNHIKFIHDQLAKSRNTPAGYEIRLCNSFARIIVDRLEEMGWTQAQLAKAAGMQASFVSRFIHSGANCTLESVGKILHALGLEPAIYDTTEFVLVSTKPTVQITSDTTGESHGEESIEATAVNHSGYSQVEASAVLR